MHTTRTDRFLNRLADLIGCSSPLYWPWGNDRLVDRIERRQARRGGR